MSNKLRYRYDIDGLRAISVIAVVLFHMGYFPLGYLGVDVFFVISGFLITSILYNDLVSEELSIGRFYMRRIRRILPLVLSVNVVVLLLGAYLMLPYDLDKLSQSVIATNLFSNNLLEYISSGDYWSIRNEYKPLMHTWSLGIEEQFYLFYPLLFLVASKSQFVLRKLFWILCVLTLIALLLFLSVANDEAAFYLIPFRFFELSCGGMVALSLVRMNAKGRSRILINMAIGLGLIMAYVYLDSDRYYVILVVLLIISYLLKNDRLSMVLHTILENSVLVFIGKLSFSLYMWHQVILAFLRYSVFDDFTPIHSVLCGFTFLIVGYFSYTFIEQPFRKRKYMSDKTVLLILSFLFVVTTVPAAWIYLRGGVVKSFPELQISYGDSYRNMHLDYNTRHLILDNDFTDGNKTRVLVIGNSFARDWINVLLESSYGDEIDVSYIPDNIESDVSIGRMYSADVVFSFGLTKEYFQNLLAGRAIDIQKFWSIGVKHYGESNGKIYANRNDPNYCKQSIKINQGAVVRNELMSQSWGDRYIDIMGLTLLDDNTMPVFDSKCQYISQDGLHFTRAGAAYHAELFSDSDTTPNFKDIFGY